VRRLAVVESAGCCSAGVSSALRGAKPRPLTPHLTSYTQWAFVTLCTA
jgi:hypothetical protein